jgi:hypothetical protein
MMCTSFTSLVSNGQRVAVPYDDDYDDELRRVSGEEVNGERDMSKMRKCSCGWMLFPEPPPPHCLNPKCPNFRKPTFGFKGD